MFRDRGKGTLKIGKFRYFSDLYIVLAVCGA